jgi:toxin HigB-1
MIKSFKSKDAQSIFEGKSVKKWLSFQNQIEKRLQILDMANTFEDLKNLPSNRFEALKGDRKGQYSIRINQQWRVCFRWIEGEVHDVEIVDYH